MWHNAQETPQQRTKQIKNILNQLISYYIPISGGLLVMQHGLRTSQQKPVW
jgi:hypothetical protein